MVLYAAIGAKALYLLFLWLISAALASWVSDRKGYGERVGLTFGLLLSVVGLAIVLLLPGRPGSRWKVDGWVPRRTHGLGRAPAPAGASGPPLGGKQTLVGGVEKDVGGPAVTGEDRGAGAGSERVDPGDDPRH
jgi:hypothetical protein